MSNNVSNKIKLLRLKNKMTQDEVAEHLNMSRSSYSRLENGLLEITYNHLQDIIKLYHLDANYLFNLNSGIKRKEENTDELFKQFIREQSKLFHNVFRKN